MPSNQTSHNDSGCVGFVYNQNIVPALYFLMFPVALLLNGVAAWISLHLKSTSTFMVYLKNLVGADIVLTLIILLIGIEGLSDVSNIVYVLGCYIKPAFYSTQYTCIGLLGLISLDRFFKIMMPRSRFFSQNLTVSRVLSCSLWLILFCTTALPNIVLSNKPVSISEITTCMLLKGPAGLEFHQNTVIYLNAFFWFISVIMVVCYICITNRVIQSFRNSGSNNNQGKKKVKLRVFVVVIVFFLFFGPYHIVRIPYTFQQVSTSETSCLYLTLKFAKELSLWFATANICMNPLLYVFLCREFREKILLMINQVSTFFHVTSSGHTGGKEKLDSN